MTEANPIYLDCAATTPVDPRVAALVLQLMLEDFGNAGSRTHEYGSRAKRAVEAARTQIARVVEADPSEVIFTSGATEANNLAILGLAEHGQSIGRMHVVSTALEHKAVLEPIGFLEKHGFSVDLIVADALRAAPRVAVALAEAGLVGDARGVQRAGRRLGAAARLGA